MMKRAAYGSWLSPLTSDRVVAQSLRLSEPRLDGDRSYWIEGRPSEGGRCVLVRRDVGGGCADLLPIGYSARTRVNEYGGGTYAARDERMCFSNDPDGCLYALETGGLRRVTVPDGRRFADLVFEPGRPRVLCVCEDHGVSG